MDTQPRGACPLQINPKLRVRKPGSCPLIAFRDRPPERSGIPSYLTEMELNEKIAHGRTGVRVSPIA
jgi:hypothetical protein